MKSCNQVTWNAAKGPHILHEIQAECCNCRITGFTYSKEEYASGFLVKHGFVVSADNTNAIVLTVLGWSDKKCLSLPSALSNKSCNARATSLARGVTNKGKSQHACPLANDITCSNSRHKIVSIGRPLGTFANGDS